MRGPHAIAKKTMKVKRNQKRRGTTISRNLRLGLTISMTYDAQGAGSVEDRFGAPLMKSRRRLALVTAKESTRFAVCRPRLPLRPALSWRAPPMISWLASPDAIRAALEPMSEVRDGVRAHPQPVFAAADRSADRRPSCSAHPSGAAISLRRRCVSTSDFRRTLRRQCPDALGASHLAARSDRTSSGACARRQTRRRLFSPADDAGQQRHAAARRPATWDADLRAADSRWD